MWDIPFFWFGLSFGKLNQLSIQRAQQTLHMRYRVIAGLATLLLSFEYAALGGAWHHVTSV